MLLVVGKGKIPLKTKLIYSALLSAVLLLIPMVCGVIDPKFSPQEYIVTEIVVIIRLYFYLAVEEILLYIKKRKK